MQAHKQCKTRLWLGTIFEFWALTWKKRKRKLLFIINSDMIIILQNHSAGLLNNSIIDILVSIFQHSFDETIICIQLASEKKRNICLHIKTSHTDCPFKFPRIRIISLNFLEFELYICGNCCFFYKKQLFCASAF